MDCIAEGGAALEALCSMSEGSIASEGGFSAHESKTWLVGRAALGTGRVDCGLRHYQAIPEYIAGFGIMWLTPTGHSDLSTSLTQPN
jgi:2,3-dihydroxyphenylpropionate 1,2-dioxygenase